MGNIAWFTSTRETWPVPSKPLVNPLEERLQGSSLPPRLPVSLLRQLEESRSHIGTDLELLPSEKSEDTRSLLSFWSESSPSSVSSEKLLRISKPILGSSLQPLELSRRPVKPTLLVCLRTPTCALSTPSVSLLCQRISSSLVVSVVNELKLQLIIPLPVWIPNTTYCFKLSRVQNFSQWWGKWRTWRNPSVLLGGLPSIVKHLRNELSKFSAQRVLTFFLFGSVDNRRWNLATTAI